jgi:hypothetical protein
MKDIALVFEVTLKLSGILSVSSIREKLILEKSYIVVGIKG